jgi:two-component system chemotaxis response regulator CheB
MAPNDIIVVGGSAGALPILQRIVKDFPDNFPAAIFVVLHLSPDAPSHLGEIVNRAGSLYADFAKNDEQIVASRIYIAPPDRHLVISDGKVQLTQDARENRSRPAIDILFRSAARSRGHRVIAVLLSGLYDDGVQGLQVVSRKRGKVIVVKPDDTEFPQMPENAIRYDHPDYVLSVSDIAPKIRELIANAENHDDDPKSEDESEAYSVASGYICPDCGGPLYEDEKAEFPHFRCHVGHAYSLSALLAGADDALESALWAAIRCLKENAELKERTAAMFVRNGQTENAARLREDAKAQQQQVKLLQERTLAVQRRP